MLLWYDTPLHFVLILLLKHDDSFKLSSFQTAEKELNEMLL